MSETINWLHFTDLHFGQSDQAWIWPKVRTELFRRLESLGKQIGGWDLVIFTGDFVQSGDAEEYRLLNDDLKRLWEILVKSGREPKLCPVPGNHDLVRPDPKIAVNRTIIKDWWGAEGIRSEFWQHLHGQYEEAIEKAFVPYVEWLKTVPVPVIEHKAGRLPGDFSATYRKNDVSLGIVGLNTTFLQIAAGDFTECLDVHVSQMTDACGGDPDKWAAGHTMSILLTHQPPTWLHRQALEDFKEFVSPPGRFFSHFCGHQHESQSSEVTESGAIPRRLRLGASLFGLNEWGEETKRERIHGYTYGKFVFDNESYEQYWPLKLFKTDSGTLQLLPNPSFVLDEDQSVVNDIDISLELAADAPGHPIIPRDPTPRSSQLQKALARQGPPVPDGKAVVDSSPRFTVAVEAHHREIRTEERTKFLQSLRESRFAWLVADWGGWKGPVSRHVHGNT